MKQILLTISLGLILSSCAKPVANFVLDQGQITAPAKVKIQNNSSNADSYNWDFGDGKFSTEENPSHTFAKSGRYNITLQASKKGKVDQYKQEIIVAAPKDCKILVKTNYGDMVILLSDETPNHRDNFIKLVDEKFYDGLLFHRVIDGFMIQGGDPESKGAPLSKNLGSGGVNYTIPAEFKEELVHVRGAVAAARTGDNVNPKKNSSGCQFYVVHGSSVSDESLNKLETQTGIFYTEEQRSAYSAHGGTPFLDHNYTVFGHVVDGLNVIDKIAAVKKNAADRPLEDVTIIEMTFAN